MAGAEKTFQEGKSALATETGSLETASTANIAHADSLSARRCRR
jgi:hypothetical protein